jgi:hypothetical protein
LLLDPVKGQSFVRLNRTALDYSSSLLKKGSWDLLELGTSQLGNALSPILIKHPAVNCHSVRLDLEESAWELRTERSSDFLCGSQHRSLLRG